MTRTLATAILLAALACGIGAAGAQEAPPAWNPRTGDPWIDQALGDINAYGGRYRGAFVDELVRYYGAPRDYVTTLLADEGWAPGDVYYACALGRAAGRSCRYVAEEWKQHKAQGWSALAGRLGIEPGPAAFGKLRKGFAGSYEHWARPLPQPPGK